MPDRFWEWAPRARRYRDPITGRFVSRRRIRDGVDELIVDSQVRVTLLSEGLRARAIKLAEWQEGMLEEIRRTQLGAQALLRGGWKMMSKRDFDVVEARIKEQVEFLVNFTEEIKDGLVRFDGTFFNRARLYPAAARVGYHDDEGSLMRTSGYTEQINVLHPSEHCVDCVYISGLGWVPIGSTAPIGSRKCLGNDKCSIEYR